MPRGQNALRTDDIEENGLKIEFIGWTSFENKKYPDLSDEIYNNQVEEKGEVISSFVPKAGKEEYVKALKRANILAPLLICNRLFVKGIKFDGNYHQRGAYGTPLLKVNELGIFKWTCSMRYWGDIMAQSGYGSDYTEWAWQNPTEPVTPDMAEEERFLPGTD